MYTKRLRFVLLIAAILLVSTACAEMPEATVTSEPTEPPAPTDTSVPEPTATPEPSATPEPAPTEETEPEETPTEEASAAAVVSEEGAGLRPGATTWWFAREDLPVGTELELEGYDPDFPNWVYVRIADGESTGWVQIANLEINRELEDLPEITPMPTLTPGPAAGDCEGGPLRLDAWPVDRNRTGGTWTATIFAEGHGGDCAYTYAWNGTVEAESSASVTFDVSTTTDQPIIGTVSVTSAGETVERELYIRVPPAD